MSAVGFLCCCQMLRVGFEMLFIECSRYSKNEKINDFPRCFVLMSITHACPSHPQYTGSSGGRHSRFRHQGARFSNASQLKLCLLLCKRNMLLGLYECSCLPWQDDNQLTYAVINVHISLIQLLLFVVERNQFLCPSHRVSSLLSSFMHLCVTSGPLFKVLSANYSWSVSAMTGTVYYFSFHMPLIRGLSAQHFL